MKRNILHFLLAVLIAFGIWTYVVTVVSPESESTYYDIPVVLNNESILLDKGLMVIVEEPPKMTLQLRGNRSDLSNLKNSDISIVADLSKINEAGLQSLNCSIFFTGNGENAFEILNQHPRTITLQIAEWASKEVPVNINFTGSLGMDYIAYEDEAILDRDVITITGPKSQVDKITQARVDVDLDGRTETFIQSSRYTLCDKDGLPVDASSIKTNAAEVNVTLKIQRVKQIQLLLDVIYGGGATEGNTVILQDYLSIKVSGSDKQLDSLGSSIKIGTVDLSTIAQDTVRTFDIVLPEGIENLTGIRQVKVDITFPGLTTKVLNVSNILVSNAPAGMYVDIATKVVEVTVRGPEELIERITEEDIMVIIDLSEAQLGDNLCKAQIMVDTGFAEIGAIGTYNVLVTLREAGGGGA